MSIPTSNNIGDLIKYDMPEFKDWLMGKFIEWEKTQPRRQSYSAFARYLNVKQSSLSQWMAGSYDPEDENIEKIAEKLGEETYDALGLPRPDRQLEKLVNIYDGVPEENHEVLISLVEEIAKKLGFGTKRKR